MKNYVTFLSSFIACMLAITSCNDDQNIQPSDTNNTEQEDVTDSTQTASETNKGDESTIPLYIPLKKNGRRLRTRGHAHQQ